jgi:hypothetical protein
MELKGYAVQGDEEETRGPVGDATRSPTELDDGERFGAEEKKVKGGVQGTCRLCRHPKLLQDSHLLPKLMYRWLNAAKHKGTAPFKRSPRDGVFSTSKHVTAYILCSDCERLLSQHGEDHFGKVAVAHGSIPPALSWYREVLRPHERGDGPYSVAHIGESPFVNASIFYFLVSVFWRASLTGWPAVQPIKLPAESQEQMRAYLLDPSVPIPDVSIGIYPNFWTAYWGLLFPVALGDGWSFMFSQLGFFMSLEKRNETNLLAAGQIPLFLALDRAWVTRMIEGQKRSVMKATRRLRPGRTLPDWINNESVD